IEIERFRLPFPVVEIVPELARLYIKGHLVAGHPACGKKFASCRPCQRMRGATCYKSVSQVFRGYIEHAAKIQSTVTHQEKISIPCLLFPDCRQMHNGFSGLGHVRSPDPFQATMDVLHPGKDIRAWHTHKAEFASVRTAADEGFAWFYP